MSSHAIGAIIVSEVRFLRECLAEILDRDPDLQVHGTSPSAAHTFETAQAVRPELILLDAAFPRGCELIRQLRSLVPETQVVAIAVAETEENILAWAEAGIAGYVPNTASLEDFTSLLKQISRGEQSCSTRIAGSLLRSIAGAEQLGRCRAPPVVCLTAREIEVLRLIGAGLSNKDISRRLCISLGTTKSHVHSVLGKMKLRHRSEVAALLNGSTGDAALDETQS